MKYPIAQSSSKIIVIRMLLIVFFVLLIKDGGSQALLCCATYCIRYMIYTFANKKSGLPRFFALTYTLSNYFVSSTSMSLKA
jgi:hypothetical protein